MKPLCLRDLSIAHFCDGKASTEIAKKFIGEENNASLAKAEQILGLTGRLVEAAALVDRCSTCQQAVHERCVCFVYRTCHQRSLNSNTAQAALQG